MITLPKLGLTIERVIAQSAKRRFIEPIKMCKLYLLGLECIASVEVEVEASIFVEPEVLAAIRNLMRSSMS